ncbi:MAG: hypothetical protein LBV33_00205 [Lachnospiraceae bacterium]|nr:hypothetical protein [Lachnospiraceae bacterium]
MHLENRSPVILSVSLVPFSRPSNAIVMCGHDVRTRRPAPRKALVTGYGRIQYPSGRLNGT